MVGIKFEQCLEIYWWNVMSYPLKTQVNTPHYALNTSMVNRKAKIIIVVVHPQTLNLSLS